VPPPRRVPVPAADRQDGRVHTLLDGLENVAGVSRANAFWMSWNLFLAFIPAVLAPLLFRHRGERTPLWWTGLALFVLFLPNAPYVITDLVHLNNSMDAAGDDMTRLTGVLPVYAAFIALGVLAYTFSLMEVGRYLDRVGLAARRLPAELGIHFVAAIGVVLGRFARLNSWEPVTEPHTTLERIVLTLSARWALVMVVGMFFLTWLSYTVARVLVGAGARTVRSALTPRTA
jgi:uncharacterized membrane protein